MQNVASQMTPGQVKITSAEKIDSTFKKFIQRVRQNMHVVICLDVDREYSLHLLYKHNLF